MTRLNTERGATIPIVALLLPVLVIMTAFAVDLGMQRSSRRTMQARADVIALDMVRIIDGRTVTEIVGDAATMVALQQSAQRNGAVVDIPPGTADVNDERITKIEWGVWDSTDKEFKLIDPGAEPDAVRITAEQRTQYSFQPGAGDVIRRAVATMDAEAKLTLGSYAARLATGASLLDPILGDALGATGGGYDGMADSDISPDEIAPYLPAGSAGAGTPEEVLDAEVELQDLMLATAQALRNDPDATNEDIANAELLEERAAAIPAMPQPVRIGDIVGAEQGSEAGAVATDVNLLDFFTAAAFIANGDSAVDVPQVEFSLPGLAQGAECDTNPGNDATEICNSLTLIQKPVVISGFTGASGQTSQAYLRLGLNALVPSLSDAQIQVNVRLANGAATIGAILCSGVPRTVDALISTGLLEADIRITGNVTALFTTVPVIISGSRPPSQTSETATFTEQPDGTFDPEIYEAGTQDLGLGTITTNTQIGSAPPLVGDAVNATVNGTVTPYVMGTILPIIEAELIQPVLNALGLNVAGADVAANAVSCTMPRLASDPQPA